MTHHDFLRLIDKLNKFNFSPSLYSQAKFLPFSMNLSERLEIRQETALLESGLRNAKNPHSLETK